MPGHSYCDEIYGYKDYKSREELTEGYRGLIERDILPNIARGLSAAVYTQVSDIEEEVNGILMAILCLIAGQSKTSMKTIR